MNVSCVLITTLDQYPQIIWDRLTQGFFDEILVNTKCPSVYDRYLLAEQAKNDLIYVQDDDCLVNYQRLFKSYDGRLTNGITKEFLNAYAERQCTLIGWGCFFPRTALKAFDAYIKKYGKDEHLLREADRIFTFFNRPFNTIIMPHEDLFQNKERMSTDKDGRIIQSHFDSMNAALEKCRSIRINNAVA